jgi:signal transduction histidine kinase
MHSLVKKLLIVGLLLLALAGLFVKTQTFNVDRYYQALGDLRQLQQIDGMINADVLKARFGLSANYDRLVADWQAFYTGLNQSRHDLAGTIDPNHSIAQQLTKLEAITAQKENQVESFKSQSAVLQNSLRYFPVATDSLIQDLARQDFAQPVDTVVQPLQQLLKDVLLYSLNGREDLQPKILNNIIALKSLPLLADAEMNDRLTNVLRHGETILRLQDEVALLIKEVLGNPNSAAIDRLTIDYEIYHKHLLQEGNRYRWLLYALVLGLCGYVVMLFQVRQKAHYLKVSNEQLERQVSDRTQALQQTLQDFQQSQSQLIQAEKMSGLGQLVAGIAHEVNNPINFIYANIKPAEQYTFDLLALVGLYAAHYPQGHPEIQDMAEEIDLPFLVQDLPKLLTSMKSGAERIRDLVLSLRNFSRLDEADRKLADLHEGIDSTILILQHRLKAQSDRPEIQVVYDYSELPKVHCYPGQINQVLMNILANAIDALEESVHQHGLIKPMIRIETRIMPCKTVQIRITDNGPGVPESVRQRIFDPFYTTKPVGQGTGLGLSISYQIIVEKHGGGLQCLSQPGQGTEFRIELPLVTPIQSPATVLQALPASI